MMRPRKVKPGTSLAWDPTWRPFQGSTRFVPHPSALMTETERARPPAYQHARDDPRARQTSPPAAPSRRPEPPPPRRAQTSMFTGLAARREAAIALASRNADAPGLTQPSHPAIVPLDAVTIGNPGPAAFVASEPAPAADPRERLAAPALLDRIARPPGAASASAALHAAPRLRRVAQPSLAPAAEPAAGEGMDRAPPPATPAAPAAPAPDRAASAPAPTPAVVTLPPKLSTLYRGPQHNAATRRARRLPRWATRPAGVAAAAATLLIAAVAAIILPRVFLTAETATALFTAPMLVLRAVAAGEVTNVAVTIGQPVEPATPLLTIHVDPLPDAALGELRSRLTQARARQSALDDPSATPAMRRQAAAEIDQLQRAIANTTTAGAVNQPILAGIRGVVWSLDAAAGARLSAGDPLVQLADCGRAFLVLRDGGGALQAGQTVVIRMPGLRPFHGIVRPSAGAAEPPNTMVIDPTGFAAVAPGACPVGTSAEIQVEQGA